MVCGDDVVVLRMLVQVVEHVLVSKGHVLVSKDTYGEEESLLAIGIHDRECDYGTQQDIRG